MANVSSDTNDLSTSVIVLRSCFFVLYGLLIISANVLSIVVTRRVSNLADSTKVLMTTMAVSDFSVGCYVVTLVIPSAMNTWPYGQAMCETFAGGINTILIMSMLSIVLVNVERYIAVTRPYKFPVWCTKRRTIVVVISALILAILTSLVLPIVGIRSEYTHVAIVCYYRFSSVIFSAVGLTVMVIIPVVIMTSVYYRLIKISREHERRDNQRGQYEANNRQDNKALKMFLVVTLTFSFCYTPYFLREFVEACTETESPDWLQFITVRFTSFNSALNVCIYCLFNRNYRQIAKKVLLERFPCCKVTAVGPVHV